MKVKKDRTTKLCGNKTAEVIFAFWILITKNTLQVWADEESGFVPLFEDNRRIKFYLVKKNSFKKFSEKLFRLKTLKIDRHFKNQSKNTFRRIHWIFLSSPLNKLNSDFFFFRNRFSSETHFIKSLQYNF